MIFACWFDRVEDERFGLFRRQWLVKRVSSLGTSLRIIRTDCFQDFSSSSPTRNQNRSRLPVDKVQIHEFQEVSFFEEPSSKSAPVAHFVWTIVGTADMEILPTRKASVPDGPWR